MRRLMSKTFVILSLFIGILLIFSTGYATDYYVKNGGNDDLDGLSDANAWATIAKVNATAFNAGDNIYFNKGDEWREQLTIPSSGSSGSPITFNAYGSGADPIINGADLVSTWTAYSATVTPAVATDADNAYIKETAETVNDGVSTKMYLGPLPEDVSNYYRFQLNVPQGATITTSYLTLVPSSNSNDGTICTVYAEDVDNASQITTFANWTTALGRITTANVSWDFPALTLNSAQNSPSLNAVIQEIVDRGSWASGNYINLLLDEDGSSSVLAQFWSNTGTTAPVLHVEYEVPNVWKATLTTEPNQIYVDGTFGDKKASVAACVNEFDWHWAANVLYLYSATDPDTAYTDPGVEACVRNRCIQSSSKSYISIEDLHLIKSNSYNLSLSSGVWNMSYLNVDNLTLEYAWNEAIYIGDVVSTETNILNSTINYWSRSANNKAGIVVYGTAEDEGTLTIQGNTWLGDFGPANDTNNNNNGMLINSGNPIIIDGNTFEGTDHAIKIRGPEESSAYSGTVVCRYNYFKDTGDDAFFYLGATSTDNEIYYNVFNNIGDNCINLSGGTYEIYNNVFYDAYHDILETVTYATTVTVKNNIFYNIETNGYLVQFLAPNNNIGSSVFDNNQYYQSGGAAAFYTPDGGADNFAQWKTATSQDANSAEADPLMTDPANDDFTLTMASPCIDKGTDVGLAEDYIGIMVPTGDLINPTINPIILAIISGMLTDIKPDIGAYEYWD